MPKIKKEMNKKTKEIIDNVFGTDVNTMKDHVARLNVMNYINNELREQEENQRLCFKLSVEDPDKKHWMKNEHFLKIFSHEFRHIEDYYSVSKTCKHFLMDLGEFLKWEMNILVDEYDYPLNQTRLAEKLGIETRTIRKNMKELEERCLIHKIEIHKEVFYIVNPYLIFIGQNINYCIPRLFDEIGYINSGMIEKETRNDRRKNQEKRVEI
ncbi:HTH domain-containing protein [Paenibacillus spiritus]|uniref:HTH domain-containing protein n=1 Tax=Paenibacillus spiritus TaxID=2496557 RepID=A0A5J5GGY3_9BACL|nr:HTH domain-containing protein [Paenibacillus spiritus]KAA9007405.1 HTH domain-containing protein [Paenibacillus spiritus]